MRKHFNLQPCLFAADPTIAIAALHTKAVLAGSEVGVGRLIAGAGLVPLVFEAFQAIAETVALGKSEVERSELHAQHLLGLLEFQCRRHVEGLHRLQSTAHADRGQPQRRLEGAGRKAQRIEQIQPAHAAKSESSIAQRERGSTVELEILQAVLEVVAQHFTGVRGQAREPAVAAEPEVAVAADQGGIHGGRGQAARGSETLHADAALGQQLDPVETAVRRHPQVALGVLDDVAHQIATQGVVVVGVVQQTLDPPGHRVDPVQAFQRAGPDLAVAVFEGIGDQRMAERFKIIRIVPEPAMLATSRVPFEQTIAEGGDPQPAIAGAHQMPQVADAALLAWYRRQRQPARTAFARAILEQADIARYPEAPLTGIGETKHAD
jgi:hypothetical protein